MKKYFKNKAERLRKRGLSYSQICDLVPVSKSTLSLWLRDINLSKKQRIMLNERMMKARLRGAAVKKKKRQDLERKIREEAIKKVGVIDKGNLFLVGVALYWAEGSKVSRGCVGQRVAFSNSDWRMMKVFLEWLKICLEVSKEDIIYEIYIHEKYFDKQHLIVGKWSRCLKIDECLLQKIYYKKHNIKKKYTDSDYFGLMRVKVLRSVNLQRKIMGWAEGIFLNYARSSNGRT